MANNMKNVQERAEELNYDSIAAMLCGEKLSEEQKRDVEEMKRQYEEVKH